MIDLTKIPKFFIYIVLAVFITLLLVNIYIFYISPYFYSYKAHLSVDCSTFGNESLVIIEAKQDLNNVNVFSFDKIYNCTLGNIKKYSQDACKIINNPVAGNYYIRISYMLNNETYTIIVQCKVKSSGLLSKILSLIR